MYATFGVHFWLHRSDGRDCERKRKRPEGVPTFNADVAPILYESCANSIDRARLRRCR